jgi:uncharacterized protein (DUF2147 family)
MTNILALLAATAISGHASQHGVLGNWVNPSKSVVMKISNCAGHLCGTVVWASEKAKRDASKGTDHLVGSHLLTHVKQTKHNHWKGKIFVPDQNITVTAKLTMENSDDMKVSGCALMICKSQVWHRTHHHRHA